RRLVGDRTVAALNVAGQRSKDSMCLIVSRVRRSIDDALDDHPADDDERPPVSWAVALSDDCDACGPGELRVVLTVEEAGRAGLGLVAHLAPDTARRLRAAIAAALREMGEPVDEMRAPRSGVDPAREEG